MDRAEQFDKYAANLEEKEKYEKQINNFKKGCKGRLVYDNNNIQICLEQSVRIYGEVNCKDGSTDNFNETTRDNCWSIWNIYDELYESEPLDNWTIDLGNVNIYYKYQTTPLCSWKSLAFKDITLHDGPGYDRYYRKYNYFTSCDTSYNYFSYDDEQNPQLFKELYHVISDALSHVTDNFVGGCCMLCDEWWTKMVEKDLMSDYEKIY